MTETNGMYPKHITYQAGWYSNEKEEEILAPEVLIIARAGTFTLADEAMARLPGERTRKWGEIKARLECKPPFPSPFEVEVVEVVGETLWLCNPTEIASDIEDLEEKVKELTDKLGRRNRLIESLRNQLADTK